MKTIKTSFLLVLLVLVFEQCKTDDPIPTVSPLGAWEETSFVATECTEPDDNQNITCSASCEIVVITNSTISFDGDEFECTIKGNTITVSFGGINVPITFVATETTLTLTFKDSFANGNCKNVVTYRKYKNSVTDIDGNIYNTVFIGSQEWMKENLKATHYNDGSEIPNVTQTDDWLNLSSGAYCNYNNDVNNVEIYGRIYNGFAVTQDRNVCPNGWHVPSLDEYNLMISTLGGEEIAGGKMKSVGNLTSGDGLWYAPNTDATNSSGFTGLPAGSRFDEGDFRDLHSFGSWRTSDGWGLLLQDTEDKVANFFPYATNGTSVRCVKD